jgi:hypothetical protein
MNEREYRNIEREERQDAKSASYDKINSICKTCLDFVETKITKRGNRICIRCSGAIQ